jgi:hypothetical protein
VNQPSGPTLVSSVLRVICIGALSWDGIRMVVLR